MKKIVIVCLVVGVIAGIAIAYSQKTTEQIIEDFEACSRAGYPIMESYPRQCVVDGKIFTEEIDEDIEPIDELIVVEYPQEGDLITSPLEVRGEARGYWFFEATFPVVLTNWDGLIIAQGYAQTEREWMTEDFVPFKAVLEFEEPKDIGDFSDRGSLILQKANPSGLSEHDDAVEMTIRYR